MKLSDELKGIKVVSCKEGSNGDIELKFENGVVLKCNPESYVLANSEKFDFNKFNNAEIKGNFPKKNLLDLNAMNEEMYLALTEEDLLKCTIGVSYEAEDYISFYVCVPVNLYREKITDDTEPLDEFSDEELTQFGETNFCFYILDLEKKKPNVIHTFLSKITGIK